MPTADPIVPDPDDNQRLTSPVAGIHIRDIAHWVETGDDCW